MKVVRLQLNVVAEDIVPASLVRECVRKRLEAHGTEQVLEDAGENRGRVFWQILEIQQYQDRKQSVTEFRSNQSVGPSRGRRSRSTPSGASP